MRDAVPMVIECESAVLVGILERHSSSSGRAVVIVVGGPQYRAGSHRMFTLMARHLADRGTPTLRFDHRGIGDSNGHTTFDAMSLDIRAAIDTLFDRDSSISEVVLWGLCDAASAVLMYATTDSRVSGLVISNPWVRSAHSLARSYFHGYYINKIVDGRFWRRLIGGDVDVGAALSSFAANIIEAVGTVRADSSTAPENTSIRNRDFREVMIEGWEQFPGPVLLILSGRDITADEFTVFMRSSRRHRRLLKRQNVQIEYIRNADHTFSTGSWRGAVFDLTTEWLQGL